MTNPFKEQIAADNAAIFLNDWEFAGEHSVNGTQCKAIVQDVSIEDSLSIGGSNTYPDLYGSRVQVNCLSSDLEETPVFGMRFYLDDKMYEVESVTNDMGLLTIQLVANDR